MTIKAVVNETFTINKGEYNEHTFEKLDIYNIDKIYTENDNICYLIILYDYGEEVTFNKQGFIEHFTELKVSLELTPEEINMLSNGMLCLIKNAYQAKSLSYDNKVNKELDEVIIRYQKLNKRLYNIME